LLATWPATGSPRYRQYTLDTIRAGSGSKMHRLRRKFIPRAIALTPALMFVASCTSSAPSPPDPAGISALPPNAVPSSGSETKPTARTERTVTVKSGQSLGEIAKAYHVSTRAIISANRLHPPYDLKTGARLIIPASETVASVKGDKPHRSRGLAQSVPAAKPSQPPEVIPLD
jgi:LysM repeat protein